MEQGMPAINKATGGGIALVASTVVARFGYMVCHDYPTSLLAGLVAGSVVYKSLYDKINAEYLKIDNPPERVYRMNALEALNAIKDVMSRSLGERCWSQIDMSVEKLTMLYELKWEDDYSLLRGTSARLNVVEKRQVVLFAKVVPDGSLSRVELHYTVQSRYDRKTANEVIKETTTALFRELSILSAMEAL